MKRILLAGVFYCAFLQVNAQTAVQKMTYFMRLLEGQYVEEVNLDSLTETAINAMLKELDPHSNYFTAEELKKANEPLEGNFEGVGVQFNILDDTILVVHAISGGPSAKVGIQDGDKIVFINDEKVAGIGIDNAGVFKRLRGPKGTEVKVKIQRPGEQELLEFLIVRDKIPIYAMDAAYMATKDVGYIKLSRFGATATIEVSQAIDSLKALGMKDLILDLCGNSGGYLNQAHTLSDLFLDKDKLIVYTEGRAQPRQDLIAGFPGNFEKGKLVVLIDGGSASASEIVAGAVQDWDRGILIGRRSFGKGLVQKTYPLPDESAIRLTMAHYYTPSGRSIQKPYSKGRDAYQEDYEDRYESGELFDENKVALVDSTPYYTHNKRVVYGGGGIKPDIYVPVDTTWYSTFYNKLLRAGTFNRFSIEYVNSQRGLLQQQYPDFETYLKKFEVDSVLWNRFLAYALDKKIEAGKDNYSQSLPSMSAQLKAMIAQYLFDSKAYYPIMNLENPIIKKALEVIDDKKTFKKLNVDH